MQYVTDYNYSLQDISAGKECKMVTNYKGGENQSTVVGYHNGVSKISHEYYIH